MTTIPTQLPVPSESPRDLRFNAGKFDEAVTSDDDHYVDRFGKKRLTIEGLRKLYYAAIQQIGFITIDSFEDGASLTSPSQALRWKLNGVYYRWDGSFPKVVPPNSSPATTGGEGKGLWLAVADPKRQTVTLEEFGADATGLTSAVEKIQLALDYASATGKKIEQHSGVFLLDGDSYLNITSSADFTGSIFKPSASWAGQIVISQLEPMVSYESTSDVVVRINQTTATNRVQGSAYFDGLSTDSTLDGCFIQFGNGQDMYTFRDQVEKRVEYNRIYNRGRLENALKYFMPNTVISLKAIKINNEVTKIEGITIDESLTNRYRVIYVNQATRVKIINTSFFNRPVNQTFSDSRLEINDSYDVTIDGLFAPSVADGSGTIPEPSPYTIGMGNSMNIMIRNANAGGKGWGATGSNNCANIVIEDSILNRIDFHKPFHNYLKVNRCTIGDWGILCTAMGDLYVSSTTFIGSKDRDSSIIATRADAGGWADGDLFMEDITVTGRTSSPYAAIIKGTATVGQGPVTNSPITSTLFRKVYIRNLKLREGAVDNRFLTLASSNRTDYHVFPSIVEVNGMDFGNIGKSFGAGLSIDFANFKSPIENLSSSENPVYGRNTTDIMLMNIQTPYFSVSGNGGSSGSSKHNPRVNAVNMRNSILGESSTLFETNQRGSYEFTDCKLERIKLSYGSNPNGEVFLRMNGGSLVQPDASVLPIAVADDSNTIVLNNVNIACNFSQQSDYAIAVNLARYTLMNDCEFYDIKNGKVYNIPFASPNATTFTYSGRIRVGQEIYIANGYTSDGSYTVSSVKVPHTSSICRHVVGGAGVNTLIATFTVTNGVATSLSLTAPNNIIDIGIN